MATRVGSLQIDMGMNIARLTTDVEQAKRVVGSGMNDIKSAVDSAKSALALLGVGLSVGALKGMIDGVVESTARLHDLSIASGATVESLSEMRSIAKLSGADLEGGIVPALQKLAANMFAVSQGTELMGGKAAVAFRTLGLSVVEADGQLKDSGSFMVELAGKLDGLENSTLRAALAKDVLGKSGAQLLPFLRDLAENYQNVGKITADQAALADNYKDTLVKLGFASAATKKEFALGLLPAMNDIAEALLGAQKKGGGLLVMMKELREDGSIDRWAQNAAIGVGYVIDVFRNFGMAIADVMTGLVIFGGQAGQFAAGWGKALINPIAGFRDMSAAVSDYGKISEMFRKDVLAKDYGFTTVDKVRDIFANRQDIVARRSGDGSGEIPDVEKINKAKEADHFLLGVLQELENEYQKLTEGELPEFDKVMRKIIASNKEFTDQELLLVTSLAGEIDVLRRVNKELEAHAKLVDELRAQKDKSEAASSGFLIAASEQAKALQDEAKAYGMTTRERELYVEGQKLEKSYYAALKAVHEDDLDLQKQITDEYKKRNGELSSLVAARDASRQAAEEQKGLWQSIESTAHSTFTSIFDSGKNVFDRLRDTLKNGLLDLLYQMTVKRFIINIAASLSGAAVTQSAFGAAGTAGSALGGLGGIGNLFSSGSSLGNLFGGASQTFADVGNFFGSIGSVTEAGSVFGIGDAIAGFASANPVGAALGVLGLLGGGKLLSGLFGGGGGGPAQAGGISLNGSLGADGLSGTWMAHAKNSQQSFTGAADMGDIRPLVQPLVDALFSGMEGAARSLGIDASVLRSKRYGISIQTGQNPGSPSVTAEELLAGVKVGLSGVSEQMARDLIPNIDSLRQANESLAQTFERLAAAAQKAKLAHISSAAAGAVQLDDYRGSLLLGDLSPLTNAARLSVANTEYQAALNAARGGDVNALNSLPSLSTNSLREARNYYASSPEYTSIFDQRQQELSGLFTDALTENAIAFAEMGLTLNDISANTKDLDVRVGKAFQAAIDAYQVTHAVIAQAAADQVTAAVTTAAANTAEVVASVVSTVSIDAVVDGIGD